MSNRPPTARLSLRLRAIASLVPVGASMADIGTDHGRLPIALLASGLVRRAIGVDRRAAPLAVADANRALLPAAATLELRLGDGLSVLQPGEVSAAVLAGMGRRSMERILGASDPDALGIRWLILQPERDPWLLRAWLAGAGWRIDDEVLVADGGRVYSAMRAIRDRDPGWWSSWSVADRLLGRPNRRRGGPELDALIEQHRRWLDAEVAALRAHAGDETLLAQRETWLRALDSPG